MKDDINLGALSNIRFFCGKCRKLIKELEVDLCPVLMRARLRVFCHGEKEVVPTLRLKEAQDGCQILTFAAAA